MESSYELSKLVKHSFLRIHPEEVGRRIENVPEHGSGLRFERQELPPVFSVPEYARDRKAAILEAEHDLTLVCQGVIARLAHLEVKTDRLTGARTLAAVYPVYLGNVVALNMA
jgi:hypothetical protein